MIRVFSAIVVFMGVLGFLSTTPVFAQKITEQFKKDMPKFEVTGRESFLNESHELSDTTGESPDLHFKIRVPKKWVETTKGGLGKLETSGSVLSEIRTFYGPATIGAPSVLKIQSAQLSYTMTAEQWLIQFLLESGYNLQGFKAIDREHAEALYVYVEGDASFAARGRVIVNGKYVLFAQHASPVERWHDEKSMQLQVLDSFKLLKPSSAFVEDMETFQFLDLAELKYPASWKTRAPSIRSIDRMDVEILNTSPITGEYGKKSLKLDGRIDASLVSVFVSETLEEELEKFEKTLREKGLKKGDFIERHDDFIFGDKFDFVDTQVYEAIDEKNRLNENELWVTIMAAGEYYYFLTLFTPSRDQDFFLWAQNTETYRLILSQVLPLEASQMRSGTR